MDYVYFKSCCKATTINLSKKQEFDADSKSINQTNFTGNLDENENVKMFFIIKEANETILYFSQVTVKVLWMYSTIYFALK